MLQRLSVLVDVRTVVVLVVGGLALLVWAAAAGGPAGQVLAVVVALLVVVLAIFLLFLVWIKRTNRDIGRRREAIKRDLDEALADSDDRDREN